MDILLVKNKKRSPNEHHFCGKIIKRILDEVKKMANVLPHKEESSLTTYYPPKGAYEVFRDDAHYEEKVREWGIVTTKAVKKDFWYKGATYQRKVVIKGYEMFGEYQSLVLEFEDGNLTCMNIDYLKEMQGPNYAKTFGVTEEEKEKKVAATKVKSKPKKEKKEKLALPEDKVHVEAVIRGFDTKYNSFTQEDEEIILYEEVNIVGEQPLHVGLAWSSYSKTLKKAELLEGDKLEFDAKIAEKKHTKEVLYKINNPSKLKKA